MKTSNLILFLVFSVLLISCDLSRSAQVDKNYSATVQPTTENKTQEKQSNGKDSIECVRTEPESIINKDVFPNTTFQLKKNEEFPFQNLGFENVKFENGDKLLIENIGCENFTLVFHYETSRFSHRIDDVQSWYQTAADLLTETNKGISNQDLLDGELKALKIYIKETKKLKYKEEIEYCGSEIRCVISLEEVKRLEGEKVKITISSGIGPL